MPKRIFPLLLTLSVTLSGCGSDLLQQVGNLVEESSNAIQHAYSSAELRDQADYWCYIISKSMDNVYDFADLYGETTRQTIGDAEALTSAYQQLIDYTDGESWDTFNFISCEQYANGVIAAEYEFYTNDDPNNNKHPDSNANKYHLFFVARGEDEEIEGYRGLWSVSIVNDEVYNHRDFSFGASPSDEDSDSDFSSLGVFVGTDAVEAVSSFSPEDRDESDSTKAIGQGYQKGPVTYSGSSKSSSYMKEEASKIEDALSDQDVTAMTSLFSSSAQYFKPTLSDELMQLMNTIGEPVSMDSVAEFQSTGSSQTSYLYDSDGETYVISKTGEYYIGYRIRLTSGDDSFVLDVYCCTDYQIHAGRLGIYRMVLRDGNSNILQDCGIAYSNGI